MSWLIELIPVFLPFIMECINNEGRENTKRNLRRPGPLVFFKINRALRKKGVPDHLKKADEICDALSKASDEDLDDLMEQAG